MTSKSTSNQASEGDVETMTPDDVITYAESRFEYIQFTFTDIHGIPRSRCVTQEACRRSLKKGLYVYKGFMAENLHAECMLDILPHAKGSSGNVVLRPQHDTLRPVQLTSNNACKVGTIMCEVQTPQGFCPRFTARRQLQRLESIGYQLYSAYELEYMLVQPDTKEIDYRNRITFTLSATALKNVQDILLETHQLAKEMGIKVECFHAETIHDQYETVLVPRVGLIAADTVINFMELLKQVADKHKVKVSLMPRPFLELDDGASLHYNFSLKDVKDPSAHPFYQPDGELKLSETCRYWIGGLMKHMKALTALCCPTVSCYRRMSTHLQPSTISWGIDDRAAALKVKNYSPEECYVEFRLPSTFANPYIVMAATVAAGIAGIQNQVDCFTMDNEDPEQLPTSLGDALVCLEEDKAIVEALGEGFVKTFCVLKKWEVEQLNTNADDDVLFEMEKNMYLDILS